ncbi:hypothetical protein [Streptococcus parasanguinis]|jgi:hypothetical protein|uniref:hypothetical protein n=1 Tax=Streptococcus parasanguinis TaxID=1318 RepID=UPI0020C91733|nr:hypothetical protein [Streptococcus parasanguinis]MCP9067488.1 hypothetical protein [Streptococcus parasanguinis]
MFQMKFSDIEEAREYVLLDKVTDLPLSTQALYLHVILNGIFECGEILNIKTLARTIGASKGDIKLLTDEKFYKQVKGVAGENK